jgi:hypothetical protein
MIGDVLPNSSAGTTTETVGFFECGAATLVDWLVTTLGDGWSVSNVGPKSVVSLLHLIPAGVGPVSKYLVLEVDGWAAVFSDGPTGTDLGVLPSRASRDLGVTAIRSTAVDPESDSFGAAIFEVYVPDSTDPQLCLRSVFAADDGGRWRFGESGDPFQFEDVGRYTRRAIRDRLPPHVVRHYLAELGAPQLSVDAEWPGYLVERV